VVEDIRSASQRSPARAEADESTTLRVGTRLQKYEIIEVLGQGGFGITYRARDTQLDRDVAIKEYLPTAFAVRQPDFTVLPRSTRVAEDFRWGRERFLDEARTLARLEHAAGIVNVHDFLEANGTAYMVMALVRGETLETSLKRMQRLPQPAIERILFPLLDGLEQVHAAGFLHRDIKPANVLIDGQGLPTLIDFGASRIALQGRTQVMTAVYTPGYAALEQMTATRQGPATDIYALAGLLYHCIRGTPPPSAIERAIEDRLIPAMDVGRGRYAPSLLAAIDAGLALRAPDRPQSIAEWRQLLSGGLAPTRTVPSRPQAERATVTMPEPDARKPRAWWPWLTLGALILCLAGSAAYYVATQQSASPDRLASEPDDKVRAAGLEEKARTEAAGRRKADEEARIAAERDRAAADEAKRRAEEAAAAQRRADDEARAAAERQRREEEARLAAEAQRRADEEARATAVRQRRAEEDARAAADAQRRGDELAQAEAEARRRIDEQARNMPSGSGPSFDCRRADRAEAYLICGDDALMAADGEMGAAYRALRNQLPEPERQRLDAQQRAWLVERSRTCGITGTTALTPGNRPGFVQCFLASTRERASALRAASSREGFTSPAPTDSVPPGRVANADAARAALALGNQLLGQRQWAKAIVEYNRSIALDGTSKFAFLNRGAARHALGYHALAIEDYSAAIRRDGRYAEALYARGLAYRKVGLTAQAQSDFQAALSIAPSIDRAFTDPIWR